MNFKSLIKNRQFSKVSSRKWNNIIVITRIGGPGVILVNLLNNREVIIKESRE